MGRLLNVREPNNEMHTWYFIRIKCLTVSKQYTRTHTARRRPHPTRGPEWPFRCLDFVPLFRRLFGSREAYNIVLTSRYSVQIFIMVVVSIWNLNCMISMYKAWTYTGRHGWLRWLFYSINIIRYVTHSCQHHYAIFPQGISSKRLWVQIGFSIWSNNIIIHVNYISMGIFIHCTKFWVKTQKNIFRY